MLQKLKRQLILVCSITTTVIVTIITLIALNFSERQLNVRCQLNLQNTLFSVNQQLQSHMLSYRFLAQMEASNETIINISTDTARLSFPGSYITGDERQQLLDMASKNLKADYSLNELPVSFKLHQGKEHYLVLYTYTPFNNTIYHFLLIEDLHSSDYQILMMRVFFGILIIIGSILLGLFSFWFVSKAIKPIEISQKEQSDFISAASHEMRSPLAVIRASTDNLLEMKELQENRYVHIINKECSVLTRFVNDLLFLANTDCGHLHIALQPTEMDTFLLEIYDNFLPLVIQKEHLLEINLPSGKQPQLMIDPERITQALSILITNALAYTPIGSTITLSLVNKENTAIISVSDNGPGIPAASQKYIFKRFYRADTSRHDTEHYGLGLSIAYEIIKKHHGHLSVSDTTGGGATFSIALSTT